MTKHFVVYTEKDASHTLPAENFEDAIEMYYKGIESVIGHNLGICGCFGPKKSIDRTKVLYPLKIKDCQTGEVKVLTEKDFLK